MNYEEIIYYNNKQSKLKKKQLCNVIRSINGSLKSPGYLYNSLPL